MKFPKNWKVSVPGWIFILIMPVLNELMLHCWSTETLSVIPLLRALGFGLAFGTVLALPVSLLKNVRVQKWTAVGLSLVLTVLYLVEYFIQDAYKVFMSMSTIFDSADGVLSDYGDLILSLLTRDLWRILLALLPAVLFAVFAKGGKMGWKHRAVVAMCGVVTAAACMLGSGTILTTTFNFDNAVRSCGLAPALVADLLSVGSTEEEFDFVVIEPTGTVAEETISASVVGNAEENAVETTEPVVYEKNVMNFDFEALAETEKNYEIKKIHSYLTTVAPSSQNAYTGLFAGKNLIFITAESFAGEVIDPELTPTLYRLANEGIRFKEYYQPLWGGSTSTGEFSNLTGLVQHGGSASMKESIQQDLFLTIGNQLMDLGYFSAAYHNNDYWYYDRHLTETGMGYATYTGMGNGMEEGVTSQWPQSDLEMVQFTLEQYIDQQPFSIYYMSVSGHALYNPDGNAMTRKNLDAVAHLDCSNKIKYYLAAQLELEYALEYLVARLEEEGIADDTVIVLGTDHYPYALEAGSTWGNDKNYVKELFGYNPKTHAQRDHSALIIWSGCIEDMDLVVDTPVYSLDILPTLSNLFGVDYDSRLLVGRDVFSEQEAIVLWPDYCWKTEKGFYEFSSNKFTPEEGVEVEDGYVERITTLVRNKISYSKAVIKNNYFNYLSPLLERTASGNAE